MVLLVDRQKTEMFLLKDSAVFKHQKVFDDNVPQKVKHGDDTWDAQNKIFRHIEDHLHRHLTLISQKAAMYARQNRVRNILIGSHKPLFAKIEKHLPYPLPSMIRGRFITELKGPFAEVMRRAEDLINHIERKEKTIAQGGQHAG